jgi:tagaturonate reductase
MNSQSIQVLQFGTGNFLRGFIEPLIEELNEQGESLQVCLVQSTDGSTLQGLRAQDYAYEVYVSGSDKGQPIEEFKSVTCIKDGLSLPNDFEKFLSFALSPELKYIISNVTEAGLVWNEEGPRDQIANSFPGRLTQWLYTRFEQAPELETILLPCELIPNNGEYLKSLIQQHVLAWKLDPQFLNWIHLNCRFHNTLVDRIVPGFPKHLEGKAAPYTVQVEPYLFWGIEGTVLDLEKLPFRKCKGVVLTDSLLPYTKRKISILNGLHTLMAALGRLQQIQTVQQYVQDPDRLQALKLVAEEEIFPFLDQPLDSLRDYASAIIDRFKNPYMAHLLQDISFQSISKFKSRLLPICTYFLEKQGTLPPRITLGLVALLLCHLRFPDLMRDSEENKQYFKQIQDGDASELDNIIQASQELFGFQDRSSLELAYASLQNTLTA